MDLKRNRDYQEYIKQVCTQIKCREIHKEVAQELENHIWDITQEYLDQGLEESEAISKAIQRMGDAQAVGRDMNKVHNPRPEWGVLGLTCLLVSIGLAIMYFIDSGPGLRSGSAMFSYSTVFVILGLALVTGLYFLDYRRLQQFSWHLYLGVVLALVILFVYGRALNVMQWPRLARNFVEISPILLAVSLAGIFKEWKWAQTKPFLVGMGLLFVPLFMMFLYPSTSAALVYAIVFMTLMLISGAKLLHLLIPTTGLVVAGPILYVIVAPYRLQSLLSFLNPSSDPQGIGWLYLQMENLRSSAGFWGKGSPIEMMPIEHWFPMIHTEMVLSYIIYSFGWLVGIALIGAVTVFVTRMAWAGTKVKNDYGKQLITGIATIFAVRFLWNVLMNLGLLPIAGIGLPFISFGAVDIMANMLMIGLVLSVYRRKSLREVPVDAAPEGS